MSMKRLWPTPRTSDKAAGRPNDGVSRIGSDGTRWGLNLSDAVVAKLPQPKDSPQSTFLQGDSPVSRSLLPGSEAARQTTVSSGLRCCALLNSSSPVGFLQRTLLESSTWHSTTCYLTWRAKGTKRGRLYFQLVPKTLPIAGIDAGLWHTPSGQEPGVTVERLVTKEGEPARIGERAYDKENGRLAQVGLTQQVQMKQGLWPSPQAMDSIDRSYESFKGIMERHRQGRNMPPKLADLSHWEQWKAAKLYPTPQATEARQGFQDRSRGKKGTQESLSTVVAKEDGKDKKLNPDFVEWMMNYPRGWTDIGGTANGKESPT